MHRYLRGSWSDIAGFENICDERLLVFLGGADILAVLPLCAGNGRRCHKDFRPTNDRRMIDAAVVIPVYRALTGELHIVMILRNPGGVHGGQIAFPGGKHDPEDETMLDTALREVGGELGLVGPKEHVLGEFPMETMRTPGYWFFPYPPR